MGNQAPQEFQYARFAEGTEKKGFTPELVSRHNEDEKTFQDIAFEGYDTIAKLFKRSCRAYPNNEFLGTRDKKQEGAPYAWKTFRQVEQNADNLAKGYVALNLLDEVDGEGDSKIRFMGIYAKNREEWCTSYLASMSVGGTIVAFYDTLGAQAVEYILSHTQLQTITCAKNYLNSLTLLKTQGKAEHLMNLVVLEEEDEEIDPQEVKNAEDAGLRVVRYSEVMAAGEKAVVQLHPEPTPDTCLLLCYTSGTTGNPKAVKLTHRNIVANTASVKFDGAQLTENDSYLSYLPMGHIFEQAFFAAAFIYGTKVGFFGGNILKLVDDCQALKPTIFPSVPRLFNKFYDKIRAGLKELQGCKGYLANRAIDSKIYYLERNSTYEYAFYDKLVCNKFKAILGGNVRMMVTGGAPIDAHVLSFLRVAFCCPILEGYGQTETCGGATLTHKDDTGAGYVGGPLACCKIRLRDIPEMEYLSTDKPYPRGEILFKGTSITKGYYKNAEKTNEAFTEDGWLASGDVGMILPNGCVKIIDRAKNIFKLAQGEYIAPEKLENVYCQSPLVAQIFVHGDSLQSFLVAIIVPDMLAVKKWADAEGKDFEVLKENIDDTDLRKAIQDDLNQLAQTNKFNGLERVKKFHLRSQEFTIQEELLTPSLKLKRAVATKFFKNKFDALYSQ